MLAIAIVLVGAVAVTMGLLRAAALVTTSSEVLLVTVLSNLMNGAVTCVVSAALTSIIIEICVDMLSGIGVMDVRVLVIVLKATVSVPCSADALSDMVVGVPMNVMGGLLAEAIIGVVLDFSDVLAALSVNNLSPLRCVIPALIDELSR